jgi:valine--pyruvate aminotransferase
MSRLTGTRAIINDIIETLQTEAGRSFINLSIGNPLNLPEVEQLWRSCTQDLLSSSEYGEAISCYGSSQGYRPLIEAVVNDFNQRYGLQLTERNVLISPGSQSIYFFAANVFGGYTDEGYLKKIILPLSPDFTGYGGVSLHPEALVAYRQALHIEEKAHRFKYRPDFSRLRINESSGCVIFSRPCNPTGSVLSDQEVDKIAALASPYNVPVFVDSAYGPPFPALNFTELTPRFGDNLVHCLSLSKSGLAGERVGIAIGDEKIIKPLEAFQSNVCIHASHYGQAIAARAINSKALPEIAEQIIRPHYQYKIAVLEEALDQAMPNDLPWFLHRSDGAIFAWLWLQDLPISDWEFYQKLKAAGVVVVPGSFFFPGLHEKWQHTQECIRISLTATCDEIVMGVKQIAKVAAQVYASAGNGE